MTISSDVGKCAITITEMSRQVFLSRARFSFLVKEGVFPQPLYSIRNRRPFYTRELQQICLQVKQENVDCLGRPFIFYAKNGGTPKAQASKTRSSSNNHADLIQGLKQLGLDATSSQVEEAIVAFPDRLEGVNDGERLRTIFRYLKRQQAAVDRQ